MVPASVPQQLSSSVLKHNRISVDHQELLAKIRSKERNKGVQSNDEGNKEMIFKLIKFMKYAFFLLFYFHLFLFFISCKEIPGDLNFFCHILLTNSSKTITCRNGNHSQYKTFT
jgi:hypothetical protein